MSPQTPQAETHDPLQASLTRLEKALNRMEVATRARLKNLAASQSQELDLNLLNADRQALANAMDEEKAARELSDRLRAEALEKVENAMELVRGVLYEAEKGAGAHGHAGGANR